MEVTQSDVDAAAIGYAMSAENEYMQMMCDLHHRILQEIP